MHPKTEIIVICGPSGAGKTTITDIILNSELGKLCKFSISHTTRSPRGTEKDGVEYYFVSKEQFKKMDFYETCEFVDNLYGTSKKAISDIVQARKVPILDVNVYSIKQLEEQSDICMHKILIKPPSLEVLNKRLLHRSETTHESLESIKKRVKKAPDELKLCEEINFDKIIINDNLEQSVREVREIIEPVLLRTMAIPAETSNGQAKVALELKGEIEEEKTKIHVNENSCNGACNCKVDNIKRSDKFNNTTENGAGKNNNNIDNETNADICTNGERKDDLVNKLSDLKV